MIPVSVMILLYRVRQLSWPHWAAPPCRVGSYMLQLTGLCYVPSTLQISANTTSCTLNPWNDTTSLHFDKNSPSHIHYYRLEYLTQFTRLHTKRFMKLDDFYTFALIVVMTVAGTHGAFVLNTAEVCMSWGQQIHADFLWFILWWSTAFLVT